jgi:tRNA (uracil-5-)-methyltransferase
MVEIIVDKRDMSPPASPTQEGPVLKKQAVSTATDNKEPLNANPTTQQQNQPKKPKNRVIKYKNKSSDPTSPSGVLQFEIQHILKENSLVLEDIKNDMHLVLNDESVRDAYHRVVENAEVKYLSSNGEGIALISGPELPTIAARKQKNQIVIVPFGIPGDIVTIKIFKTHPNYAESDLLEISTPSKTRDESLIKCGYFGKCSGCQYQMLPYGTQLDWKRDTIVNAYRYLASKLITSGHIPEIGTTVASPKQYGYRTKLTPHFDIKTKRRGNGKIPLLDSVTGEEIRPSFGFGAKGKSNWRKGCVDAGDQSTLDIEECVIGTGIVNVGLKNERERFLKNWGEYKKSATVLLREHTRVFQKSGGDDITVDVVNQEEASRDMAEGNVSYVQIDNGDDTLVKSCVTNPRQVVTEYINGFTFQFSAGEFFQNNNSILPQVTNYVCENLQIQNKPVDSPLYLVDAYCGSGLFSITASKGVDRVVGVDVSKESIKFANLNAERNGVTNVKFIDGKAEKIFNEITTPNDLTSVIIDPSRKGCDDVFLNQLSDYKPARVVYVSCNVHSQARDLEQFISNTENGKLYTIESIRGFDFFPQTHHVESVAVLSRSVF